MTRAEIFETQEEDSATAGESLGRSIRERFEGGPPDVVLLFASPVYAPVPLLEALHATCEPGAVVGCTSAGEFTFNGTLTSSAVALAIRSDDLRFGVHVGRELHADLRGAAATLASTFDLADDLEFPYRTALVLMDTLAGYGDEFLNAFTDATAGIYPVFGGGAADDAAFSETFVFAGRQAITDAAVALEMRSRKPIGIGVSHGWTPASHTMTVTSATGLRLEEIDGKPAIDAIEAFAREEGSPLDRESPLPFFLHHVLGIETSEGYKLRVPLKVEEDGSVVCAAEVLTGSNIRIMRTRNRSAAEAARVAAQRAWRGLQGHEPGVAIFFDCAATRLRMGDQFGTSVDEIVSTIGTPMCIGCNTYGQFARREGQFSGFHNCTAVVCVLPR